MLAALSPLGVFMSRFSLLVVLSSCLSLIGCVDEMSGSDAGIPIQPQSGEWYVMTTGWNNDDCNADEGLTPPTSIVFEDVEETSFFVTFFENDEQIGSRSTCHHDIDDFYICDGFTNGFAYIDAGGSVSMSAVATIKMTSETTASGSGDFVLECSGADCAQAALETNTGAFPCGTTLNWTAEAE